MAATAAMFPENTFVLCGTGEVAAPSCALGRINSHGISFHILGPVSFSSAFADLFLLYFKVKG